jgi:transcriptional regulator with XRE-family HTH domain
MDMTQPEIIQVLRRRTRLNQGTFGAQSFTTSFESGRTKVKKIELGKQIPTYEDLKKMAGVLGVSVGILMPETEAETIKSVPAIDGVVLSQVCLDLFPGLETYVEMFNNAAKLGDEELIVYISEKIAAVLTAERIGEAVNQ